MSAFSLIGARLESSCSARSPSKIPDEIRLALKATPDSLASTIRFAASVKLHQRGQLSSGASAQLAGVPKPYFLSRLADYGMATIELSEEELSHDLKNA